MRPVSLACLPLIAVLAGCGGGTGGGFSDSCNARAQQGLVGGPVEDMAALALAAPKVRFVDPGDAVTTDDQPDRLNVVRDENDVVTRVYCG